MEYIFLTFERGYRALVLISIDVDDFKIKFLKKPFTM